MDPDRRNARNEKRRKSYAEMDSEKKADLLKQRRLRYAQRNACGGLTPSLDRGLPAPTYERGEASVADTSPSTSRLAVPPNIEPDACPNDHLPGGAQHVGVSPLVNERSCRAHVDLRIYPSFRVNREFGSSTHFSATPGDRADIQSHFLPVVPDCGYCGARRFYHEPPGFCCSEGEISVASSVMSSSLCDLCIGSDPEAVAFRKYARSYNNNLAFTNFSTRKDKELLKNNQGIYNFKVQGKVHHYLPCLEKNTDRLRGLQLYFYDPDA